MLYLLIGHAIAIVYMIADLKGRVTLNYRKENNQWTISDNTIMFTTVFVYVFLWPLALFITIKRNYD